jgi:hypothetical protein
MDIPTGVQTHELPSSTLWIKDGIVYSTPKVGDTREPTSEQMKEDMLSLKTFVGDEKICLVVEINPKSKPASKKERDAVAAEIASMVKAMAVITSSPITKMLVNLFFGFKPPAYPLKMFLTEKDATNWVKQYL